eukprot:1361705-Rhodomonas_salina.2
MASQNPRNMYRQKFPFRLPRTVNEAVFFLGLGPPADCQWQPLAVVTIACRAPGPPGQAVTQLDLVVTTTT